MKPTRAPSTRSISGCGHEALRRVELAPEALHVLHVIVGALAVLAAGVVAGAAREIRRRVGAGQRAVRDAVAVHVLVAAPLADARDGLRVQHLAAIDGRLGIRERIRHPRVHAEVEIAHDEHRRSAAARPGRRRPSPSSSTRRPSGAAAADAACRRATAPRSSGCRPAPCASAGPWTARHAGCRRSRPALRRSSPSPVNSPISDTPGPDVDVIARAPTQLAPMTIPMAAISSSACTMANVALPVSLSMRYFRM